MTKSGIPIVAASGNFEGSASTWSPARNSDVITVGAMDINYKEAKFSNNGPAVDIFAPGVKILSTNINGTTKTLDGNLLIYI